MPNNYVLQRLAGIQGILVGVQQASASLTAASRGQERAAFIDSFLAQVLPPIYRFGNGDCTDVTGNRSGQLDVVVEYPFSPSLPSVASASPTRLYLAEAVAAVIEVKSNIAAQWNEAKRTAEQLAPLRRHFGAAMIMGRGPTDEIPLFVAGYTGWKSIDTVQQNLAASPAISGALVIDNGLFVSSENFGGIVATGPWALWGLIATLHAITNGLQSASTDPLSYAR
jgi:hypothetical protein